MKIVVLYGGVSPEREVSLNSGAAVAKALCGAGFEAELCDIRSIEDFIKSWPDYHADGVFIALHGGWGEDGRLQAALEAFGIPYTGSGPEASMLAMDKRAAKLSFVESGVDVPRGFVARLGDKRVELAEKLLADCGKLIVKPNGGGSTVGVTALSDISGYEAALELACQSGSLALVEEFIEGEEATVPVFEDEEGHAFALPAIHIEPKVGYYDYKNKYTAGNTVYICPSDFSNKVNGELARLAVAAHNSIGCRVYSRVDFRVAPDGSLFALELNTAPGMTATSLVPKSAKAAGMDFGDFLAKVVRRSFAIDRNAR